MTDNNELALKQDQSSLKKDRFSPELLRRFVDATKKLVVQGEKLQHATTGTDMILFIGRSGNNIIDIQTQGGQDIQQLFVTLIGENESLQLKINHQHEEIINVDVERFAKASYNPGLRQEIEKQYPRGITRIQWTIPADEDDFTRLTKALETTVLDEKLLENTVKHDTATGVYVKANKPKLNVFSKVLSAGKKMLTG